MINLNTHKAYSSMRSKRKRDCDQNNLSVDMSLQTGWEIMLLLVMNILRL